MKTPKKTLFALVLSFIGLLPLDTFAGACGADALPEYISGESARAKFIQLQQTQGVPSNTDRPTVLMGRYRAEYDELCGTEVWVTTCIETPRPQAAPTYSCILRVEQVQ